MNHFLRNIVSIAGFFVFLNALSTGAAAQEISERESLTSEVKAIIGKYEYLAGNIAEGVQPDPVRPFIQLFRNPRVMVYDDLDPDGDFREITIREYAEKIRSNYPEGLKFRIDTTRIRLKKTTDEQESRQMIEVSTRKVMTGSTGGSEFSKSVRLVFIIGYDKIDGELRNFLIHDIEPVSSHPQEIVLSVSPSLSRLYNSALQTDQRFESPWRTSWAASFRYQYMLNGSWGIGTGLGGAILQHNLHLDRFDPLNGRDPNIRDIDWDSRFYYMEIPFYGVYRMNIAGRLVLEADLGLFLGYRIFEETSTIGVNSHSGLVMEGVVSDPFNYENISQIDTGIEFTLNFS